MQQMQRGRYANTLILAIALALLLTSCASSPETVTVTETVAPPPIDFPTFPDPSGFVEVSEDGETVYVDTEYWVQIAEYAIDVRAAEQQYESFREIYGTQ